MNRITEKTVLPISLVIVLIGGVAWLTTVYAQVRGNTDQIASLKSSQDRRSDDIERILRILAVMEEKLSRIEKRIK